MESCKDVLGEEFGAGEGAGAGSCTGTALPLPVAFMDPMPQAWWVACLVGGGAPDCIGIASSDQVQRQQRRDEPVRENTHLMLDTLASRLRSYHSIVGVESLVFQVIRTQLIYIQSIVCMSG